MNKVNIMNYKICLYALFMLLSVFVLSGVNIEKIMKKGKVIEANILIITLSMALSYLVTNFVLSFLNI